MPGSEGKPASEAMSRAEAPPPAGGLLRDLWLVAKLDAIESLRARWFLVYTLVFGGTVALLFTFSITESQILGFMGLSRLLVTYIQICMAILPIFVLISTVRSVAGDREACWKRHRLAGRTDGRPLPTSRRRRGCLGNADP